MKKLLSFVLVMCLVLNISFFAMADEISTPSLCKAFPLHGSVRFGMTPTEVNDLEISQGSSRLTATSTDPYLVYFPNHEIAGFSRARIYYGFDENENLIMMEYIITNPINDDYLTIAKMLTDNYGNPVAYCHPTSLFTNDKDGDVLSAPVRINGVLINNRAELASRDYARYYEEWLIEKDDGYIFIQHCFMGEGLINDDLLYGAKINYDEGINTIAYVYFDKDSFNSFNSSNPNNL